MPGKNKYVCIYIYAQFIKKIHCVSHHISIQLPAHNSVGMLHVAVKRGGVEDEGQL